ncbi:MAG: carbamoyl phosphate synthase small subunit [Oscillospiraceae bacterium]|nr:carbamoyl phosphate synthase small subunit [Oscillospiraceae bacterium]
MTATLILENGAQFRGTALGDPGDRVCEMVFNTSMAGYQEVLTDPSYAGQGIVMTYPLIGNYGVNKEDEESIHPWAEAFVVRRACARGSNFRREGDLDEYLKEHHVAGISDVDTRAITKVLRGQGTMNGMITTDEQFDLEEKLVAIRAYRVAGTVEKTTRKAPEIFEGDGFHVALMDFGVKQNMIRSLVKRGCKVTVLPAHTPASAVLSGGYDGVMLSNGPGDPADCTEIIGELKKLYESELPIFGVCLGHQLMALATGAKTEKLKYGHRGGNHPVRDIAAGRVYITSQNHGYCVVSDSVDPGVAAVSHVNVNDGTCEGLQYVNRKLFTVQFHPEAAPGPQDTAYLFDRFVAMMGGDR